MQTREIRVLLIEDNIISARLQEGMLAHAEAGSFHVQRAETLLAALDLLAKAEFDIAILDLTLPDSQGIETFLAVQHHAPGLPVIVVTGVDDESVALNAVRHGAQDFLVKGELRQEKLVRALNYALARSKKSRESPREPPQKAAIIGLIGSKGGVGTTTLACHWALELKRQTGETVLLADLDESSATTSFLMKVEFPYTLVDAAVNLHRLDADLWSRLACHARDGLDLLQSPGAGRISDALTAERVRHVLRFAQLQYRWVVVDLGRLSACSLAILDETRDLLVITTAELTALYEASRLLGRLVDVGLPRERLKLILNRMVKRAAPSPADVEKALGCPCYASIRNFSDELDEAYATGRFLDEKLKLREEVARTVERWRGGGDERPARSALGFLRRRRS